MTTEHQGSGTRESATASAIPPTLPEVEAPRERRRWPCLFLYPAIPLTFLLLQMPTASILSLYGFHRLELAMLFDAVVLGRVLIAHYRKERGHGWLFYMALMLLSPWWIGLIFEAFARF